MIFKYIFDMFALDILQHDFTAITTQPLNNTVQPPPGYSAGAPPGYSNEALPGYSYMALPGYSAEPPQEYSAGAPPEYSNGSPLGYSNEAPPGYSNKGPTTYSNQGPPGYSNGASPGYSNGAPRGYSNGASPGCSNEAPPGYSNGAQRGSSNIPPSRYSYIIRDTSSEVLRHTIHEQTRNTSISTISYPEQNSVISLRSETYNGSSPRRHQSLSPFPIIDIYTLADSQHIRRGERNTDSREASQAYPDQTTRQSRSTFSSLDQESNGTGGNEVKFRCGDSLLFGLGVIASLWCCLTGYLTMYFAYRTNKLFHKNKKNKAKTSENIAIVLLIISYVVLCGGLSASIVVIIIQHTSLNILALPLSLLIFFSLATLYVYCRERNAGYF